MCCAACCAVLPAMAVCWAITRPFLVELVETVIQSSESAYPELREHDAYIKKVIGTEEENFGPYH